MKIIRVNAFHSSTAVRVPFAFFIKSTEFHQWRESADEFFFFLLRLLFFCVWFKSSPVAVGFCSLMKKRQNQIWQIKFGKQICLFIFVYSHSSLSPENLFASFSLSLVTSYVLWSSIGRLSRLLAGFEVRVDWWRPKTTLLCNAFNGNISNTCFHIPLALPLNPKHIKQNWLLCHQQLCF